MNCADFEKNIYTFSELSAEERKNLEDHLATCTQCAELFQSVNRMQGIIQVVAERKKEIRNAAQLTHRIMERVAVQPEAKPDYPWSFVALEGWIRYALSTVSLLLLIGFGTEFFNGVSEKTDSEEKSTAAIVINSSRFREEFARYKKNRTTKLVSCATPLRQSEYLQCLKNRMK